MRTCYIELPCRYIETGCDNLVQVITFCFEKFNINTRFNCCYVNFNSINDTLSILDIILPSQIMFAYNLCKNDSI